MNRNLRYDFIRYKQLRRKLDIILLYNSSRAFQAVCLYRLSNFFYQKGYKKIAIMIKNKSIKNNGCEIGESTKIGRGLRISNPVGIVISGGAIIGENLTLQSGVVIGTNRDDKDQYPIIGNNVYIGAGAKVLGNITIGNNVIIGANSVVLKSVNDNAIIVGVPGKEK